MSVEALTTSTLIFLSTLVIYSSGKMLAYLRIPIAGDRVLFEGGKK